MHTDHNLYSMPRMFALRVVSCTDTNMFSFILWFLRIDKCACSVVLDDDHVCLDRIRSMADCLPQAVLPQEETYRLNSWLLDLQENKWQPFGQSTAREISWQRRVNIWIENVTMAYVAVNPLIEVIILLIVPSLHTLFWNECLLFWEFLAINQPNREIQGKRSKSHES